MFYQTSPVHKLYWAHIASAWKYFSGGLWTFQENVKKKETKYIRFLVHRLVKEALLSDYKGKFFATGQ
jgi:hypothetical protein